MSSLMIPYIKFEFITHLQKPQSESEVAKKSMPSKEIVSTDANEEKKKKKRKRKQANDLRFEGELEKLGASSKRKQRKKE